MEVFEYLHMSLYLGEEPDLPKNKGETEIKSYVPVMLDITTFEGDTTPLKERIETIEVRKKQLLYEWNITHSGYFRNGLLIDGPNRGKYYLSTDYPLTAMAPYFAVAGKDGWEVVEYKFSTDPFFGQALLKRKVQKE